MVVSAPNLTYLLGNADGTGWRQLDIMPTIINQDPRDRPFFELSGMGKAEAVLHQWQTRGLRARAISAIIEGADFTYTNVTGPDRQTNTCMIMTEGVEVSGTSQEEQHYGISNLFRDQIQYKSKLHGLDQEFTFINSTLTTGNTASARRMKGLREFCTTTQATVNVLTQNGATLTESTYILAIETGWNQGAPPNTALMGSKQQKQVDNFSSIGATRWMDVTTREVVHSVLVYHSTFGTVENHISRDLSNTSTTGEIIFFDKTLISKAYFRPTRLIPVAKTSDAERMSIITEATLQVDNPESLVYVYQLAAPA